MRVGEDETTVEGIGFDLAMIVAIVSAPSARKNF